MFLLSKVPNFLWLYSALLLSINLIGGNSPQFEEISVTFPLFYEECFTLTPEQRLEYEVEATQPVEFNIHYHPDEETVQYRLEPFLTSTYGGAYEPDTGQEYCWMWLNPHPHPAQLTFRYRILD